MKRIFLPILAALAVLLAAGCRQGQKPYTIKQVSTGDHVEVLKTNLGHVIRDTVGLGPVNERIDITDSKGRPLAVAGKASEVGGFCFVKYLYDAKGEVKGFIRFPFNEAELGSYDAMEGMDAFMKQFDDGTYNEDSLDDREVLFDQLFARSNDEPYFERFYLKRDSAGRIIKVFDPVLHKSITADEDWHIEYRVEEDANFWESDLEGGLVWVTFCFKPNDPSSGGDDAGDGRKFYGYTEEKELFGEE